MGTPQCGSAQCAQECYGEVSDKSLFYVEDPAARPDTRLILVGIVKLEDPASFLKIGISGDFVSLI